MNNPYTPRYVDELTTAELEKMLGLPKKRETKVAKEKEAKALQQKKDLDRRFKPLDVQLARRRI